jgi:hypothetical protein
MKCDQEVRRMLLEASLVPVDAPKIDVFRWGDGFLDREFPRERFQKLRAYLDTAPPENRDALEKLWGFERGRTLSPAQNFYVELVILRRGFDVLAGVSKYPQLPIKFPLQTVKSGCDIRRLRACDECGNAFYAENKKKLCCSRECSNKRKVRLRLPNQARYEQTRKEKDALRYCAQAENSCSQNEA